MRTEKREYCKQKQIRYNSKVINLLFGSLVLEILHSSATTLTNQKMNREVTRESLTTPYGLL